MRKKHLFKLLGLSMLVAVSAMAISASAAQAEWQILLNKASVNSVNLAIKALPGHMFVSDLGLTIACTGGKGKVTATKSGLKLNASGSVSFTGCTVNETDPEVCQVHGKGDPNGTVTANGTGEAKMTANPEIVEANLNSAEFAKIEILGEECSLTGFSDTVNGGATITVLEALKDLKEHVVHANENGLKYGTHSALLLSASTADILGHITDEADPTATLALHLINL